MIRSYKGITPTVPPTCYVDASAQIIGDVVLGEHASVWMNAVVRGDVHEIRIGAHSNVQDNSVLHAALELPTTIGDGCTIGHMAHLEGCLVEDGSLVGSGSVVLHKAVVGKGATGGANAVETNNMIVPPGALAVGVPAVIKEGRSNQSPIEGGASIYVMNGKRYAKGLVRLDPPTS